jgi:DNA-binding NarL/FixJ family response regulator
MTTRVLIVDDHPLFRDALAELVASLPDLEVAGLAADGSEAVNIAAAGGIDIVLMDLNLPSMSGVEATDRIQALDDPPSVLVLTMVDDDDTVVAALRAGARGYVLKGAAGEEVAAAVRTIAAGGAVFGAGVAAQVLAMNSGGRSREPMGRGVFTDREREVLALLAEGSSNKQIALALGLSLKTVQNYVSRILDKLQVSDRTQAALKLHTRKPL